jgi:hypothetical protein
LNRLITLVAANIGVGWAEALGMYLRGSLTPEFVLASIVAAKADLAVSRDSLEAHALAGGDPQAVVETLLILRENGESQDFERIAAMDLAGRDLSAMKSAYAKARERFPNLAFNEILTRQGQGGDVVASILDDTFLPRSELGGWRVRLELGPLTFDQLRSGVASGEYPEDSLVLDPESGTWRPIRQVVQSD